MGQISFRRLLIVVAALVLLACGPTRYLTTVTFSAAQAVEQAKQAKAEQRAPYEYWSAVTYLRMSREKVAYGDYQVAIKYGERASEMARKAKWIATGRPQDGSR